MQRKKKIRLGKKNEIGMKDEHTVGKELREKEKGEEEGERLKEREEKDEEGE